MKKRDMFLIIACIYGLAAMVGCDTEFAVPSPEFDPPAGTFETPIGVTISCADALAAIWYTVDGTDPTLSDTAVEGSSLTISDTTTVKAVAKNATFAGEAASAVSEAEYSLDPLSAGVEVFAVGNTMTAINNAFYWHGFLKTDGTVSPASVVENDPVILEAPPRRIRL